MLPTSLLALLALAAVQLSHAFPCNQEVLLQCANSLQATSEGQFGFATKKEDLDQICPELNSGLRCIDEYTRRCMAPHQRSHFNKLYAGSSMVIQEICQEGPYQDEFLKHASCMWDVKKDYEECAHDYQQKIQVLSTLMTNESSEAEHEHHVRKLCCSFQEYLSCSHEIVLDTCGPETATFTKGFLDRMSSSLIQAHCEKYPSGSQICGENVNSASSSGWSVALLMTSLVLALLALLRT